MPIKLKKKGKCEPGVMVDLADPEINTEKPQFSFFERAFLKCTKPKKHQPSLRTKLALQRTLRTELRDQGIQGVDSKLLRELGEDNVEQSVIGEEIAQLSEEYDLRAITWRQRMVHFLHTMPVEVFMMSLVVIDVLIILGMVVLDMYILEEQLELVNFKGTEILVYLNETWPHQVAPGILDQLEIDDAYKGMVDYTNAKNNYTHAAGGGHSIKKRSAGSSDKPNMGDFGKEHTYDAAKMIADSTKANHILHYCSIAILAVFVVEVGLKIVGYGKGYFKNKWELIDGIVILISFSLDVAVTDANFSHEVGKTVLVVFLIWRVIRILNAMVLTSRARTMFRLRVLRKSKRIAEDKNKQYCAEIVDLQTEVKRLRMIARTYGAEDHEIVSAQVLSKTSVSSTKAGLKNMMAQLLHINAKIATSRIPRDSNSGGFSLHGSSSCTSLNKLNANGYNRSRRPSMIGDQTMCHEMGKAAQASLELIPARQRASSDAGGMTRLTRKLRDHLADLKSNREGAGGITQEESLQNVHFDHPDHADNLFTDEDTQHSSYKVVDETLDDNGNLPLERASRTQERALLRNDSGVVVLEQREGAEPQTSVDSCGYARNSAVSEEGHANPAFKDDDNDSNLSRLSDKSEDSGFNISTNAPPGSNSAAGNTPIPRADVAEQEVHAATNGNPSEPVRKGGSTKPGTLERQKHVVDQSASPEVEIINETETSSPAAAVTTHHPTYSSNGKNEDSFIVEETGQESSSIKQKSEDNSIKKMQREDNSPMNIDSEVVTAADSSTSKITETELHSSPSIAPPPVLVPQISVTNVDGESEHTVVL